MEHDVKIPSLGESIVSGILTQWMVQSGDYVKEGDQLYELETDKITSEGMAEVSGKIELLVEADNEVEIGQVVAKIDDSAKAEETEDEPEEKEEEPEKEDSEKEESPDSESEPQEAESDEKPSEAGKETEPPSEDDRRYPPSVERIAAESGIDPSDVEGSGKDGRVTKGDMLRAAEKSEEASESKEETPAKEKEAAEPAQETPDKKPEARTSRKKMTPLRRKIAERLVTVKNEAAILTTFNEVDMTEIMKVRKEVQEDFKAAHGIKLGFMSFFVKAAVRALQAVPAINAQIEGQEIITNHYYDIGVAVGTEKGLVVPVLRDCEKLSFQEIEQQLSRYAQQARDGKLSIDDLQGGVFTISNGGVYGSLLSTPIINPPQSGILGMHTIQERPVAVNGKVEIRPMMYLALSYDHRLVDGKEAVSFLIHVKDSIENPNRMIFGL